MHNEAFTYTRQTLEYPPPCFSTAPEGHGDVGGGPLPGDALIPGGTLMLGATPDEPFVFDNEKWAHPVKIEPFAIARAAVTQSEFATFTEDNGYHRKELWSTEGWEWRESVKATQPVYWKTSNSGWLRRHFDKWVPLEPHLPVIHVNYYEAEAYCRWAGRRLPTEAEWETAAAVEPNSAGNGLSSRKCRFPWGDEPPTPAHANLDWGAMGCIDVGACPKGDSAFGCRQMIGNVWEWTSTPSDPTRALKLIHTKSIRNRGLKPVRYCAAAVGQLVRVSSAIRGVTSIPQIGGMCWRDFGPVQFEPAIEFDGC